MEKPRAGSESFLHRAFLRAAEIWDVRIGVYNIRSMAGNAIMNGETRYLTEKEAVRTVDCWGPIPQEPAMRSFYLQCMRFFAKCQCAKGKMFRLFPESAFPGVAARSGKADCFMQRRGKRDVPAVSRARRRIERLRGVQFCRRALEIRSEVSAPARLVPRRWAEKRGGLSLLGFGSGGRGDGRGLFSALKESGYGGLCPHPPRNLRFLGFSFCCRVFGWRGD